MKERIAGWTIERGVDPDRQCVRIENSGRCAKRHVSVVLSPTPHGLRGQGWTEPVALVRPGESMHLEWRGALSYPGPRELSIRWRGLLGEHALTRPL